MASITKQEGSEKVSKKQFSRTVLARLTNSLAEFNLKDKKLESRLKKVSKQLAADIMRKHKADEKAQETDLNGQEHNSSNDQPVLKQKKTKKKELAATAE